MMEHRGAVVAWSSGVTAAAVAAAALLAPLQKHPFSSPWVILFMAVGGAAFLLLLIAGIPDVTAWAAAGFRGVSRRESPPALEVTRWSYTSDGMRSPAAATALEVTVPGSVLMRQPGDQPWIRYAILVGCGPAGPDFDARAARARFLAFLSEPPVADLVSALAEVPGDADWSKRAAHDSAFDAVLTSGGDDDAVASARLELPDGTARFGRDACRAVLIIHVESSRAGSRAQAGWIEWAERVTAVLQAVPAVAGFLSGQLGLEVLAEPQPQVAVRLETPGDLAQLIGTSGLDPLPGRQHMRQAISYFTASPGGAGAGDAAEQMIRHILRVSLSMDI